MKQLIILFSLIMLTPSCKAQTIIRTEDRVNYRDSQTDIPDDSYVKDVNGVLNKFLGTWIGTYDNKTFEFGITKYTRVNNFDNIKSDELRIKYLIKDANGHIIEDTTNEPDNSYLMIRGKILEKDGTYKLNYVGREAKCGQVGTMFIEMTNTTKTQFYLGMLPSPDTINSDDCPNGEAQQIFPFGDFKHALMNKQ